MNNPDQNSTANWNSKDLVQIESRQVIQTTLWQIELEKSE
jgi:hypothetical protein